MTMGLGMALLEATRWVAARAASPAGTSRSYHVATDADVRDLDAVSIEEDDPHLNPMGAKGIGEIGITGTAAAIGNAVYHATGRRVRDLPITRGELLGSPAGGAARHPRVALRLGGATGGVPVRLDAAENR